MNQKTQHTSSRRYLYGGEAYSTLKEVAEATGHGKTTVRKLIRKGVIKVTD